MRERHRAERGAHAARVDDVLHGERDAVQQATGYLRVEAPGLRERACAVQPDPRVQGGVALGDPVEGVVDQT